MNKNLVQDNGDKTQSVASSDSTRTLKLENSDYKLPANLDNADTLELKKSITNANSFEEAKTNVSNFKETKEKILNTNQKTLDTK